MALGNAGEQRSLTGREKHDREICLLGRRPEPVRGSVGKPCSLLTNKVQPNAENAGLVPQRRQALRSVGLIQRDAGHDGETARIALDRLLRIIKPLAFERRGTMTTRSTPASSSIGITRSIVIGS